MNATLRAVAPLEVREGLETCPGYRYRAVGARRLWTRTVDHGGVGPVPEGLDEGSVPR
ncbi:hypothetical protein GCM10010300_48050 [Streptomyces olivaceoviridis]|nr:hypothetical protein GCM10010300_48050 [Streptomyces olivaceoviridis]